MTAVKVVLSNGEGDELELGAFNQGVLIEGSFIRDVASREVVAFLSALTSKWHRVLPRTRGYDDVFIHAAPAPTEESTVEHYADGDRRTIDGIPMLYQSGEWLADGECRVDDDGNGAVLISVSRDMDGERKEYARVCDIFGGHHRSVSRAEWESWGR